MPVPGKFYLYRSCSKIRSKCRCIDDSEPGTNVYPHSLIGTWLSHICTHRPEKPYLPEVGVMISSHSNIRADEELSRPAPHQKITSRVEERNIGWSEIASHSLFNSVDWQSGS